jgi:GGDEF domain-containing protein
MAVCGGFDLSCGGADLRASIGVACGERGAISADELVRQADAAMYRSKSDGQSVPVLAA